MAAVKRANNNSMLLFAAALSGDIASVRELVDQGTDVNSKDTDGYTPLARLFQGKTIDVEVLRVLVELGADSNACHLTRRSPLFVAVLEGSVTAVRALIELGSSSCTQNADGRTPLLEAVQNGHVDVGALCRGLKADLNASDVKGCSPIFVAAERGYADMVSTLAMHGADVNMANTLGETPIGMAACGRIFHVGVVKALLEFGADIEKRENIYGDSPLTTAARHLNVQHTALLVNSGACVIQCLGSSGPKNSLCGLIRYMTEQFCDSLA